MKCSTAATMIAAANPGVLVAASTKEEQLERDSVSESNPISRAHRTHWTMPKASAEGGKVLTNSPPSKSALITNQRTKDGTDITPEEKNLEENIFDKDGEELGILSSSRRLEPASPQGPDTDKFDSFTTFDRDRTAFYSICDPSIEDEYFCSRCDTNSTEKTVADFECQKVSCYEIDSRCDTNMMVVCRYDTLSRLFESEPIGDASVPYESEKCRTIEARLSKTNRKILPSEESSWGFSYCLRYSIESLSDVGEGSNNTCEMEVDGTVCSSCSLETVNFSPENSTGPADQEFCVNFDCENTFLGYSGRFCDSAGLAARSLDYFVYRSLPCDGGCNLCGEAEDPAQMMMMSFREAFFEPPDLANLTQFRYLNSIGLSETLNCFESQWDALTTNHLVCADLQLSVESPCGCIPVGVQTLPPPNTTKSENTTATDGTAEDESSAIPSTGKVGLGFSALLASFVAASLIGFGFV